ncbi:MAG: glycosyltransferase, partial [Flavobacteriales bacterium]|nr:glycosyltransferase [Flavobacteriales bacterium]
LSKEWGVPYVVTEHTGPFSKVVNSTFKRISVKKIMENANAVLAVSNHLKNEILNNKIQPQRIEVTYNPVDTELFLMKENKHYKNIVFAGRMDENKGALRALKAFHLFYKANTDWTLTFCGEGIEMNSIKQYVKDEDLKEVIIIKGMLKEEEVAHEFQQADIFISPTQYESFGLAIAEAMSCGLPVITTITTAPPEYVNDSCGILLDVDNIEEMAEALSNMVANLDKYDANSIRASIVNQFGVSNFGQRLLSIYKSL